MLFNFVPKTVYGIPPSMMTGYVGNWITLDMTFPRTTMRSNWGFLPTTTEAKPAGIRSKLWMGCVGIMSHEKPIWLTFEYTLFCVCVFSNLCLLTTPAFAEAAWRGSYFFWENSPGVTAYEPGRLPLDVSQFAACFLCNLGRSSTATFAEFYGRFVCGMIHLSLVLSRLSAMPRGCYKQSPWPLVSVGLNYSTDGL